MRHLIIIVTVLLGSLLVAEPPGFAGNCTQPVYDVIAFVPVQFPTPFGKEKALLMYDTSQFEATLYGSTLNLGDKDAYLECIDVKDINNDTKSVEKMRVCAISLKINDYATVLAAEAGVGFPYSSALGKLGGCDVTIKVDFAKAYDLDKAPLCAAGDTACKSFSTVRDHVAKYVIADLDKDGVVTAQDNCWAEVNKDQVDSDQDKIGDVCDLEKTKAYGGGTTGAGSGSDTGGTGSGGGDGTTTQATACKIGFLLYHGHCYKDTNADGIADTPLPDPSGVATSGTGDSGQTPGTGGTGTGTITATTTADTGGGCSLIVNHPPAH